MGRFRVRLGWDHVRLVWDPCRLETGGVGPDHVAAVAVADVEGPLGCHIEIRERAPERGGVGLRVDTGRRVPKDRRLEGVGDVQCPEFIALGRLAPVRDESDRVSPTGVLEYLAGTGPERDRGRVPEFDGRRRDGRDRVRTGIGVDVRRGGRVEVFVEFPVGLGRRKRLDVDSLEIGERAERRDPDPVEGGREQVFPVPLGDTERVVEVETDGVDIGHRDVLRRRPKKSVRPARVAGVILSVAAEKCCMGSTTYDFSDETVIVTGGSSGIGRATAIAFGDAGATVIVADVRAEPKDLDTDQPTHEAIREANGTAEYVETDVSDPDDVASVVKAAREYGGVDVMINNAGLFRGGSITDLGVGDLRAMLGVNVEGLMAGTQIAARDMLDRDDPGCIVNTASISSSFAQHEQVGYDATKGAVRMLTRGAALELAGDGIRVNAVAPGQIATEFLDGWTETAQESVDSNGFLKDIPMERAGTPADVAPAILYLASDAAGYTTGELLHVDGGWQVC